MRAAANREEQVRTSGRLFSPAGETAPIVEIGLPRHA
jgi:hypothetical protein